MTVQVRSKIRRRRVLIVGLVVAVLAATAVAVLGFDRGGAGTTPSASRLDYELGQRPAAPPLMGETLDGGHLDVTDLHGQVVVVNVWASWCPPCRQETADFEAVYQATRDQGVAFVGINTEDTRDKAVSFIEGRVSYPSIFDPASAYALGFTDPPAPIGLPMTMVIDRSGHLATAIYRAVGPAELRDIVTRVAAEP